MIIRAGGETFAEAAAAMSARLMRHPDTRSEIRRAAGDLIRQMGGTAAVLEAAGYSDKRSREYKTASRRLQRAKTEASQRRGAGAKTQDIINRAAKALGVNPLEVRPGGDPQAMDISAHGPITIADEYVTGARTVNHQGGLTPPNMTMAQLLADPKTAWASGWNGLDPDDIEIEEDEVTLIYRG